MIVIAVLNALYPGVLFPSSGSVNVPTTDAPKDMVSGSYEMVEQTNAEADGNVPVEISNIDA